jgi:hypothetical protein
MYSVVTRTDYSRINGLTGTERKTRFIKYVPDYGTRG